MSLYGALFSGVSGLSAQSSAMGAISDNITNVNTIGYKGTQVNFQSLVTKNPGLTEYSPGGVLSKPRASIDSQGLLQASSSSTDMAISGNGMFVVNTVPDAASSGNGAFSYTRAGSFKVDNQGYLQNVAGNYIQGWPLSPTDNSSEARPGELVVDGSTYMKAFKNSSGVTQYINQNAINADNLKSLNLKTIGGTADPTTQIKMGANLPSGDGIFDPSVAGSGGLHETNILIYDSLGNTSNLTLDWMKTNANTWDIANKTNFFGVSKTLADSTTTGYTSASISVDGQPTGGSSTVVASGAAHGMAFFAGTGVVAYLAAGDAAARAVGTKFTVAGASDAGNNGTFLLKTGDTTSPATTTLNAASASGTVTLSRNGSSASYTSVDTSGAAGSITFGGATKPSLSIGDVISVADTNGNIGYYSVGAYNSTTGAATVTALHYNTIDTAPFQTERGIQPPAGSAVLDIYDPDTSSDSIYASQARLDFTANSRADVLAMGAGPGSPAVPAAKTFTITPSGTSQSVKVGFYNGTGTKAAFIASTGCNIVIDVSSPSITTGSAVADLVAKALSNASNWDSTNALMGGNTAVDTSAGATIPLFRAKGSAVEIVQQTAVQDDYAFDVSGLGTSCTQSQARQWNTSIPSVDTVTGTFSLRKITATSPAVLFNGDGTPQAVMGKASTTSGSSVAPTPRVSIVWANGAQSMTEVPNGTGADHRITTFFGNTSQSDGMTQLGGTYQLAYSSQNGAKFGNYSGVSIGTDGVVTALFDNGVRRPIFQIPVATFTNYNGMEGKTGNSWIDTALSGSGTLRVANSAGSGAITASSLEASTVDIGTEFTTMIVTQRAYSAAAKIITTADQMLDELIQIKR
jgi:flagellar hook protein FlgE